MIQMVIMIMIRRVILQRVNVRMNCINCSLETNELQMKMQDIESKVYNCHLSWWKSSSSAGRYMNLGKLVITYFAVPVHLLHLSISGVKQQESSHSREIG